MRHGVLFYEATGLIPADLTFRQGVLFYDSTRKELIGFTDVEVSIGVWLVCV